MMKEAADHPAADPLSFDPRDAMDPMFLSDVEQHDDPGPRGDIIRQMRAMGAPVPQIMHLFAFNYDVTQHLERFTQGVLRGPSPLTPGQRELIAAFTSRRNECPF